MLMNTQFLKEMGESSRQAQAQEPNTPGTPSGRNHVRNVSMPEQHRWRRTNERQPLLRRHSLGPEEDSEATGSKKVAGGTVLGIHNLAIVMPQFIVRKLVFSMTLR